MALTEKDVRYIAGLAHLELKEDELKKFLPQLGAILEHIHKLDEVDTTRVEPMAQVTISSDENAATRRDQSRVGFSQEEALANAPESGGGSFKVPSVIEKE